MTAADLVLLLETAQRQERRAAHVKDVLCLLR